MRKRLAFLFGLLIGGFTGYVLGVLYAPRSAEEGGTASARPIELRNTDAGVSKILGVR